MRFVHLLVIFSLVILPQKVLGVRIVDKRGSCELDLPSHWKYERDLFGLPHVFLSPGGTKKVSVSLTVTGLEAIRLPSHELMKNQDQYQNGRKEWAKRSGAEITSFYPYEKKMIGKVVSHQIGVDYKLRNEEHSERSSFFECSKSLIHMKAVGPKTSAYFKEALLLMETLKCPGDTK